MTEIVDVSRIRDLNDQLRRSLTGGVLVMTKGIIALGAQRQLAILSAIAAFDDFSPDNKTSVPTIIRGASTTSGH